MNAAEYDAFTWGKIDPQVSEGGDVHILHWSGHKLSAEVGEVNNEIAKRDFHNRPVTDVAIIYELGDVLFYVSVGAQALGVSLDTIMEMNVAKLTQRGDYANYLRQQEAPASSPSDEERASFAIETLKNALRVLYDRFPALDDTPDPREE